MAAYGMGGPMGFGPMGFGSGISRIMDINPGFIYGRAIASGDKYIKWREKISFKDAVPIDEMYYGDPRGQLKAQANIEKTLRETTKNMINSTKEVRKDYAKVIIINSIFNLKQQYGSLDFSKRELNADAIQKRITQDLCTKDTGNDGALLSDCENFYNKNKEHSFIESFISKAYRNRNNQNWLNDNMRSAGNDYQHYYSGLTVYHYHNYNIYNFLLGNLSLDDFDSELSRIPGMLPDIMDENELYARLVGKKKDEEVNKKTRIIPIEDADATTDKIELDDVVDVEHENVVDNEDIKEDNFRVAGITAHFDEDNNSVSIHSDIEELNSWRDLISDYLKSYENSNPNENSNINENRQVVSSAQLSTRNHEDEMIEMLSNIEVDEVDFSSMKGFGK